MSRLARCGDGDALLDGDLAGVGVDGDLDRRNPGQDFQHRPVPLLHHVQLRKHERERHPSSGATVSHIKRNRTSELDNLPGGSCQLDEARSRGFYGMAASFWTGW